MTHPAGYFTNSSPQVTALVERFGDFEMKDLPVIDQLALTAILASFAYRAAAKKPVELEQVAEETIPESADYTTDAIAEALDILKGINMDTAIALIQFLVQ